MKTSTYCVDAIMEEAYEHMDCGTLFKTAKAAYDKGDEHKRAHQLFRKVVEKFPGTHEAEYAEGFMNSIRAASADADAVPVAMEGVEYTELKLAFSGSAKEYFRIWIVNLCLTLITLGIFSAWAKVRKKRYFYSNLILDNTPFQYLGRPVPILKGRLIAAAMFFVYYISSSFFTYALPYVLALGLVLAPWVIVSSASFNARYSSYRNITFRFSGTYWESTKTLYVWALLPALVIGTMFDWWGVVALAGVLSVVFIFYFPWWLRRLKNFIITRTSFGGIHGQFWATGGQFFIIYLIAFLILLGILIAAGILVAALMGLSALVAKRAGPYILAPIFVLIYAGYAVSYAYIQAQLTNRVWNQTRLGPLRFKCTLRAGEMAKIYITNVLAIMASAGLLIPWAVIRVAKYRVQHTKVYIAGDFSKFQAEPQSAVQATGAEVGDLFDIDMSI